MLRAVRFTGVVTNFISFHFICELCVAAEVFAKDDLDYDDSALFLVEGDRVWRGRV